MTRTADPAPNKALMAALTTIVGVLVQWISTGHLSMSQEGTTAITGAIATILVYLVSNHRRLLG